jgi:hypothetical protein
VSYLNSPRKGCPSGKNTRLGLIKGIQPKKTKKMEDDLLKNGRQLQKKWKTTLKKNGKQAGAELCQAQVKLGLAKLAFHSKLTLPR